MSIQSLILVPEPYFNEVSTHPTMPLQHVLAAPNCRSHQRGRMHFTGCTPLQAQCRSCCLDRCNWPAPDDDAPHTLWSIAIIIN